MPKYDFACGHCGAEKTVNLTMAEYEESGRYRSCHECGKMMQRVYINIQVPTYSQAKGHYNSSYEGRKETVQLLKNGGEKTGQTVQEE